MKGTVSEIIIPFWLESKKHILHSCQKFLGVGFGSFGTAFLSKCDPTPSKTCLFFPECVAKGSRLTLWSLGVEVCSLAAFLVSAAVCNRLQASATLCKRPSWQNVAVPMGKVAKGVIFRGSRRLLKGAFSCEALIQPLNT